MRITTCQRRGVVDSILWGHILRRRRSSLGLLGLLRLILHLHAHDLLYLVGLLKVELILEVLGQTLLDKGQISRGPT